MNPQSRGTRAKVGTQVRGVMISGLWAVFLMVLSSASLEAQEPPEGLSLKRDLPPAPEGSCEILAPVRALPEAPEEADRLEAEQLASEASRAAILGDPQRAMSLLQEAAELDPTSPAIAYRLARIFEDAGEDEQALGEFCRYLALDPHGPDAADVDDRIERIAPRDEDPLSATARAAFEAGVAAFDDGSFEVAAQHFSRALVEVPDWPDAHYNRGIAYLRAERTGAGAADLEWYLETSPDGSDRERVEAHLRELDPDLGEVYSPRTALTAGLVVPGMGHFYSGRPGAGLVVLATAGASAAVGVLYRRVEVDCLTVPVNGTCPPGQTVDRREDQPLLVPGLAGAAAITVIGAIHAFRGTRGQGEAASFGGDGGVELSLLGARIWKLTPVMNLGPVALRQGGGAWATLEFRF